MINRIILDNFKCFKHMDIELSKLNIFAGINSMGKSTAIQALLLLRQSFELNAIDSGLFLNGKYVQVGSGKDLLNKGSDDDFVRITLETDKGSIPFVYHIDALSDFQKLKNNFSPVSSEQKKINLFYNSFVFISADRLGPQRYYESSYHDIFDNNQVGINGELFADYLAKRGLTDKITNKLVIDINANSDILLYQTNAWLSKISPDMIVNANEDSFTGVVSVSFSTDKYSPKNVGFGLSYLVPIIVAILKAKEGDLLIIENPEAHIHPKGQRIMGELIARAAAGGVQIIVETHSDHVLNGIRLAVKNKIISREDTRLNFFYRDSVGGEKTLFSFEYKKMSPAILENGELSDWPDGFFDEWDKALMELL